MRVQTGNEEDDPPPLAPLALPSLPLHPASGHTNCHVHPNATTAAPNGQTAASGRTTSPLPSDRPCRITPTMGHVLATPSGKATALAWPRHTYLGRRSTQMAARWRSAHRAALCATYARLEPRHRASMGGDPPRALDLPPPPDMLRAAALARDATTTRRRARVRARTRRGAARSSYRGTESAATPRRLAVVASNRGGRCR